MSRLFAALRGQPARARCRPALHTKGPEGTTARQRRSERTRQIHRPQGGRHPDQLAESSHPKGKRVPLASPARPNSNPTVGYLLGNPQARHYPKVTHMGTRRNDFLRRPIDPRLLDIFGIDKRDCESRAIRGTESAYFKRMIHGEWADTSPGELELPTNANSKLKQIAEPIRAIASSTAFISVCGSYFLDGELPPMIR